MKADATRFFVCPLCRGELRVHSYDSGEIMEGRLDCACGQSYAVRRGVPRFLSREDYTPTFGRPWSRWTRARHDSLNRVFHDRFVRYTDWAPASMAGQIVVEAGCGVGAFIEVVARHAAVVVGFDRSTAVDACYQRYGRRPSVYLAQADVYRPPLRTGAADRLYTFGAVQHTPDPEGAFRCLLPLVKAGGEIAVRVYRRRAVPHPRQWLRLFTAGMREPQASRFVEWYVPKALAVSGALARVPGVGGQLRRLVPVADYRGVIPMSDEQYREWAVMDTHDGLITRYTFPQRWRDLQRWMHGLEDLRRPSPDEMAAVARVPARPSPLEAGWSPR